MDEVDEIVAAWQRERPDLDLTALQVLSRISRLAHHLDAGRKSVFAKSGLEPWEFDVLASLRRSGKPYALAPKDLIKENLVTSGTMTNRIDQLEKRGLVVRRPDPADGRSIAVLITDAGKALVDAAFADLLSLEAEFLADLTKPEQDELASLLRELTKQFKVN
ncbi:MAG: MarR family winged helix-turn-helix transcriptional regulator [Candidatus Nanopelagicales bacterium]|jgi:DNA-binding MarR family transcriptional regulator